MGKKDHSEIIDSAFRGFFASGKIPHAVIIQCPDKDVRDEAALRLSQAVLCSGDEPPCGKCESCRRIKGSFHPDLVFIRKDKKKVYLGVDLIKEMKKNSFLSPEMNGRKVYVIEDAHNMTVEAQNALLKLFEEPPEHVSLILTVSSCASLLETIISRGTLVTLEGSSKPYNPEKLSSAEQSAVEICRLLLESDEFEMLEYMKKYAKNRKALFETMDCVVEVLMSGVRYKNDCNFVPCDMDLASRLSARFSLTRLISKIEKIKALSLSVKNSANINLSSVRFTAVMFS